MVLEAGAKVACQGLSGLGRKGAGREIRYGVGCGLDSNGEGVRRCSVMAQTP